MKSWILNVVVLALVVLCRPGQSRPAQILKDSNFEKLTQASTGMTTGTWFVKFYAPWCGHCKALAPKWEDLSEEHSNEFTFAKVDCTKETITCKRFGVRGYPTLILLKRGQQYRFSGKRETDNLIAFARNAGTEEGSDIKGMKIPGPKSWLAIMIAEHSDMLLRDLRELFVRKKNAIFFILGIGTLLGLMLGCACSSSAKDYDAKKHKE